MGGMTRRSVSSSSSRAPNTVRMMMLSVIRVIEGMEANGCPSDQDSSSRRVSSSTMAS